MRWFFLAVLLAVPACMSGIRADSELSGKQQAILADVRFLCEVVEENYVYLGPRAQAWSQACVQARSTVAVAKTSAQRLGVLEGLIDALYDPHASLGTNSSASPRLVPSGSDYVLAGDRVVGVRPDSGAALAGVQVGDRVIGIDGQALEAAVTRRIQPQGIVAEPAQLNWAANAAAAGYRDAERSVNLIRDGRELKLLLGGPVPDWPGELVTARMLEDGVAYLRINNSLGDDGLVEAFDAALEKLKSSHGWILDLRDTPGGGNTGVAEPIMGRFITREAPYQRVIPASGPAYDRMVAPRGPWTVAGPLTVLVGRWTGSMGEGMAIGFDGMGRGHVIGSQMAGLAGGTEAFILPQTGISVQFPTYDLAHLDGTPRHDWQPGHRVTGDNGNGPDLALMAARQWLEEQVQPVEETQ